MSGDLGAYWKRMTFPEGDGELEIPVPAVPG
jgi:hypothetical protein